MRDPESRGIRNKGLLDSGGDQNPGTGIITIQVALPDPGFLRGDELFCIELLTKHYPVTYALFDMYALLQALIIALLGCAPARAADTSVMDIPTRPGVTQRFLVIKPEQPAAAVILFAGGDGGLNISPDGAIGSLRGNFLVRSRNRFAEQGLMVAVIDAPSDRLPGGLGRFRLAPEHVQDIGAVIAALRKEATVPVWLVGTSRGTTSVAHAAIALKEGGPDGIVLSATIVGADWGSVPALDTTAIRVPVLVGHHEQDECRATLPGDVRRLMTGLQSAPRAELVMFAGGGPPKGPRCEGFHYHGFVGIEDDVVKRIADWIKANAGTRK